MHKKADNEERAHLDEAGKLGESGYRRRLAREDDVKEDCNDLPGAAQGLRNGGGC